ncbi:MAG: xanthine dehydrogenase family protein subunit M [Arenicellales bacterium]|jgi:CO/xanthine dehydrogenase FAD-binding subunit|nr:xanthine dehydrogenase family protein subunit M [Arenicellales bacterium]MDP6673158.1 xanthine dehydrogenase family protein subunit M [Arenicellales bacterium]MDP6724753.1 xanthine dehydrogenase family protein subunit M [Arenicellales bacterium]|tara:strand:+ start:4734 stop:5600 length:867 start_codon:yes stop_codon:yes gene_type:complete
MTNFKSYLAPATLDEAVDQLNQGNVTVLAGGSDLMLRVGAGNYDPSHTLMNILKINELRNISFEDNEVQIGTLTTITEIREDPELSIKMPLLGQAADQFASMQIRNVGTIGGNICNASPAGDMLVPLLLLDAAVELARQSDGGVASRRVALKDFFVGPGKTQCQSNELLTRVSIPFSKQGFRARFYKFGTRPALDISTVSIGIGGIFNNGYLQAPRVAFGAVAPVPFMALKTMKAIEQSPLDSERIKEIAEIARDEIKPIDDVRATAWYRKQLVHNLTIKVLSDVTDA